MPCAQKVVYRELWARPLRTSPFFLETPNKYSFGIFRIFSALSSSISFEIHKVFLQEIDLDRPQNLSKAALADLSAVPIFLILFLLFGGYNGKARFYPDGA